MGIIILSVIIVLAYKKISKNGCITNVPLLVALGGIGASLAFSNNTGTATVFGWAIIAYAAANAIMAYRRRDRDAWYLQ